MKSEVSSSAGNVVSMGMKPKEENDGAPKVSNSSEQTEGK